MQWRNELANHITEAFNEPELRELCFQLGIPYDDDIEINKGVYRESVQNLISYCERHTFVAELIQAADEARPNNLVPQSSYPLATSPSTQSNLTPNTILLSIIFLLVIGLGVLIYFSIQGTNEEEPTEQIPEAGILVTFQPESNAIPASATHTATPSLIPSDTPTGRPISTQIMTPTIGLTPSLSPTDAKTATPVNPIVLVVGDNGVNLRNGPGVQYSIIIAISKDSELILLCKTDQIYGWYNVEVSTGEIGWVSGQFVEVIGEIDALTTKCLIPTLLPLPTNTIPAQASASPQPPNPVASPRPAPTNTPLPPTPKTN